MPLPNVSRLCAAFRFMSPWTVPCWHQSVDMDSGHSCAKHDVCSGDDWQTMIRKGANQAGGSALTGDWKPLEAAHQRDPTPPAPSPASQKAPAVARSAMHLHGGNCKSIAGAGAILWMLFVHNTAAVFV